MKCIKCGQEMSVGSNVCEYCHYAMPISLLDENGEQMGDYEDVPHAFNIVNEDYTNKKKPSVLAILSVVFGGVGLVLPVIIAWRFGLAGAILGIVDLALQDKTKDHKAAVIGLILSIASVGFMYYQCSHVANVLSSFAK